ncbi:aminodeoxychorismate synthase component I [Ideonella sp. DXS29W]|uniref:Aminodeoxychorismate synthase component I n=1 Tax=Ideonella lacteola TaxID=2984193 RepID=A0ABU9BJP3_9BURK
MSCFALLDDRAATAERPTSRLYTGWVREHSCTDPRTLDDTWRSVQADQAAGLHAVLLADYEWGAKLLGAGERPGGEGAALRVLMFSQMARLGAAEVAVWLRRRQQAEQAEVTNGGHPADEPPCGVMGLVPSVDRAGFVAAIGRIHEAIAGGETYQVNYTYRLHGQAYGSPVALYRALRARQPVRFGALIALPEGSRPGSAPATHVLSCSPELFLRHEGGVVTARPMKGTAARRPAPEGDSETARWLAGDAKNRAENLMIVDLLRNDLGRIAQIGSVKVPSLFAIEPYSTVFQMTSTVQARLRPEIGLPDLLRATFPCGSITGAPKHHTMDLIAGLETTPRGLYCGAIGWVDAPAPGAACGDFCLSVAIRTLVLGAASADGTRPLTLGVGAGIVRDSQADDEFDECQLKARFLTGLDPGFGLIETLLVMPGGGLRHLPQHLARLERSARCLGFAFDGPAVAQRLHAHAEALVRGVAYRLRLELAHDGTLRLAHAPLQPVPAGPATLLISPQTLPGPQALSAHKTTRRAVYDAGVRAAEQVGAFDSLFFTHDGRLVEGGRSSVFLRLQGRWWTPPVSDGALPGVLRGVLLADSAWAAAERTLRWADVLAADEIVVCNALRGALPARLLANGPLPPNAEQHQRAAATQAIPG